MGVALYANINIRDKFLTEINLLVMTLVNFYLKFIIPFYTSPFCFISASNIIRFLLIQLIILISYI